MNAAERVGYLALGVAAIVLAFLKLWWPAALCVVLIPVVHLLIRDLQEPED
jgi:hypothetical protein